MGEWVSEGMGGASARPKMHRRQRRQSVVSYGNVSKGEGMKMHCRLLLAVGCWLLLVIGCVNQGPRLNFNRRILRISHQVPCQSARGILPS